MRTEVSDMIGSSRYAGWGEQVAVAFTEKVEQYCGRQDLSTTPKAVRKFLKGIITKLRALIENPLP